MHTPRRHRVARNEAKFRRLTAAFDGATPLDVLEEQRRPYLEVIRRLYDGPPTHPGAPSPQIVRRTRAVEEGIDWDEMSLAERRDRES